jgi:hypothetical protein
LLHDFKFADERSDRAHAIGMLVQPFVRELIDGPTPLYRVEAAVEGSGKGLLVDVLLSPALGNRISRIVEAANDDAEWRKIITTELLTGNGALIIDNVRKLLASGVLAKALTDIVWNDRLLGSNRDVALPVRWVWAITANNPLLSAEMMRRAPRIRIDPKCEHPERRTGFQHPYLRKWATENRPLLIWSALVLCQHWKAKDCSQPSADLLGSYEDWTRVVGGILKAAGIEGFLASIEEDQAADNNENGVLHQFVSAWFEQYQENEQKVADLYPIAKDIGSKLLLGKGDSEQGQKVFLGIALKAKFRGRVVGVGEGEHRTEYQLKFVRTDQRAGVWQLKRVEEPKKPSTIEDP